MLNTFYTLRALAGEWDALWRGARVGDVFSQARGELTIALAGPEQDWMLRVLTDGAVRAVFHTDRYSRARRNSVTLFEEAFDRTVEAVRTAERDRMLFLDLSDGLRIQVLLFGPRPNVFLTDADGRVVHSFKADDRWAGRPAPAPRAAPRIDTFEAFAARWPTDRSTRVRALTRAFPLFDTVLAEETILRAGLDPEASPDDDPATLQTLFEAGRALETELADPDPRIYWRGDVPDRFALVPLTGRPGLGAEAFERVGQAAAVFVRRSLAMRRFDALYRPLRQALETAHRRARTGADRMLEELSRDSRADRYERWGHLLMAQAQHIGAGSEELEVEDLFDDGGPVTIPLDPRHTAVENAQIYYDRARRTRQARTHAEARLDDVEAQAQTAADLLARLEACTTLSDLEAFVKDEADRLEPFTGAEADGGEKVPFRRYTVHGGYEVWVGRNARQNDALTLRHARKYDLWMHARGVSGSHVVLRRPDRNTPPDRRAVEEAAAIAAYWSDARTSRLAPVQVAERKYVRKPKGSPPGAVVVTREDVVLVEPGLPG